MPTRGRRCGACGFVEDFTELPGGRLIGRRLGEPCKLCGAPDSETQIERIGRPQRPDRAQIVTFPYYDHGLGLEVTSWGHRRKVMNERGLEEAGGESVGVWDDIADKQASANAEIDQRFADYMTEMSTGPARGEFAQLQAHLAREQAEQGRAVREQRSRAYDAWREECAKIEHEARKKSSHSRRD